MSLSNKEKEDIQKEIHLLKVADLRKIHSKQFDNEGLKRKAELKLKELNKQEKQIKKKIEALEKLLKGDRSI